MKVLFACGGSGGHITPAIAMAEILTKHYPHTKVAFVGNENGMERQLTKDAGFPFYPIAIEGLHRSLSFRNLRTLFLAAKAPVRAAHILKEFSPDLVIGTGGYVSYPMIPAARRRNIPTLLYEPNAVPGLAVRMTEKDASLILLQFDACAAHLKYREKARTIGAPLRCGFESISRKRARETLKIAEEDFVVLAFGGSLGAERLSLAISESFAPLGAMGIKIIHATGKRLFDSLSIKHPKEVKEGKLLPYINNMSDYMAAANVVVCRAGAMTLAELSRSGRAAILIPSPYVAENHQEKNARLYEKKGAGLLIKEDDLCAETLCERILFLKRNPALLHRMEKNAKAINTADPEEAFLFAVSLVLKSSLP